MLKCNREFKCAGKLHHHMKECYGDKHVNTNRSTKNASSNNLISQICKSSEDAKFNKEEQKRVKNLCKTFPCKYWVYLKLNANFTSKKILKDHTSKGICAKNVMKVIYAY